MYPTLTRYAGPRNANSRRSGWRCATGIDPCTSSSDRRPRPVSSTNVIDLDLHETRGPRPLDRRDSPGRTFDLEQHNLPFRSTQFCFRSSKNNFLGFLQLTEYCDWHATCMTSTMLR